MHGIGAAAASGLCGRLQHRFEAVVKMNCFMINTQASGALTFVQYCNSIQAAELGMR
jgi:hypothetical protein